MAPYRTAVVAVLGNTPLVERIKLTPYSYLLIISDLIPDQQFSNNYSNLLIYSASWGKRKIHGISRCTVNQETLNTVDRVKTDFWGKEKCTVNRETR